MIRDLREAEIIVIMNLGVDQIYYDLKIDKKEWLDHFFTTIIDFCQYFGKHPPNCDPNQSNINKNGFQIAIIATRKPKKIFHSYL